MAGRQRVAGATAPQPRTRLGAHVRRLPGLGRAAPRRARRVDVQQGGKLTLSIFLPSGCAVLCRDCLQAAGIVPPTHRTAGGSMATSPVSPSTLSASGFAAPAATPARYLTNSEAADYLRLSPRT